METYRKAYLIMMNGAEDALRAMDRRECRLARELLIEAQQRAEECFLSAEAPDDGEA